ncbi:hypothetical protein Dsin_020906 [Dipteronia sinensis]|uniref:O-fucosyltransferase family protein n=1 Tax=Dipteronia sinensis TaxID=43782 RepID=A0AAE0E437_9ROSI|nr:hypothetical protein Dsin_020906 [Dipteronia sinensis]
MGTRKVVGEGKIASKDPMSKVHLIPLGPEYWKIAVTRATVEETLLTRPTTRLAMLLLWHLCLTRLLFSRDFLTAIYGRILGGHADYVKKVLPLLVRNGIVHFLEFGNRLGFDPLPYELQRLRCKCNFHALKFVPKILQAGALLVRRIRKYDSERSMLDKQLLRNFIPNFPSEHQNIARGLSSYLALHLRFEEDMIAYFQYDFRGRKDERNELNFKHTVKSISLC